MLTAKTFKGANVFMSRNLVPPEVFDALLDALKQNGAEVFLCCDPSRNGPNDFHVISSPDHEKFELLRSKGCNLLGPQCVLCCAKEHKALPKQGFVCCLAMDGVKILASGFDMDEKVKIEKLVAAMGGLLHSKASLDVSFVVAKNVLAAKYKWALNVLKKPVVTVSWLHQCWNEHRVVPQEPYRVLPFSGLTICVTRISAEERKGIEKNIIQNGGKYSPELTKKCTHLISDAPEGDKYKVAVRWGHIHIVTRKWLVQSVMRKACLNEEAYTVQVASVSLNKTLRHSSMTQHSQDKSFGNSALFPLSVAAESSPPAVHCAASLDPDLEATLSQKNMSSMFSDPPICIKEGGSEIPAVQAASETNLNGCVANDSQSEDNNLYLSECRISLVGFEASRLRKLVRMIRKGGGSRYMSFNDKLTHIIVGVPSEAEKKELRGLAASGVIHVVATTWLEDCDREKKEMPVLQQHIAHNLILPKGNSVSNNRGTAISMTKGSFSSCQSIQSDLSPGSKNTGNERTSSLEKARVEKPKLSMSGGVSLEGTLKQSQQNLLPPVKDNEKDGRGMHYDSSNQNIPSGKSSVFKGKTFCFSKLFPEDRKAEIIQWVGQGGGEVVNDCLIKNVHFIIECHGVIVQSADVSKIAYVSSHWIHSCLEEGCLLDIGSHIIYSPVPCQVPLPGFENFRFCISQYEEKDRLLLRNLCFVLGAKFVEKLTRKVTHLLCKFKNGPKYEAACKWGICSITCEWIYECIKQNKVVAMDPFQPKEVTSQDEEAGLCVVSQFPVQAGPVPSGEFPSQLTSQSQDLRKTSAPIESSRIGSSRVEAQQSLDYSKKARLLEDEPKGAFYSRAILSDSICNMSSTGPNDNAESSHSVPDVAAAIEDLLEQTSKIHEQTSPGRTECDKSLFPSDCSMLGDKHGIGHPVFGLPKHWLNRTGKKDELTNPSRDANGGIYDGFSETQTESQVVGYEEDLSGRQMLIDRVRTRSSVA